MYNGIGLTTPRGSGTNGHIQSNKFFVRPKSTTNKDAGGHGPGAGLTKKPNRDILEHDRKRQMELKLVVLEDKLADQGYTDSEIAEKISEVRKNLEAAAALEDSREDGEFAPLSVSDIKVSDTQTHQVAARKEKQMETLRAALGMVPDAPSEKDGFKSIPEDGSGDEISDGSDKDLNDDVRLLKKDHKNRNDGIIKAVKVKKNESDGDGNELKSHKNQGNKELGELTESSDTEADEKHLRSIPKQLQKYRRGSASESDSNIKSKNLSRRDQKVRRHDSDYLNSDEEKYVKETHKAQDKRSRRHEIDQVDSDDENYESKERHVEMSRKHYSVKSENEKYGQRQDKKSRRHERDDSLSDHEHYERTSEMDDTKNRRSSRNKDSTDQLREKKSGDGHVDKQLYRTSVKSENEKYGQRQDKKSRRHERDELSDHEHYERTSERDDTKNRRSSRNKDSTDQLREKKSGDGHVDKQLHRTYGDEAPQMEISKKNDLDRKKEERDHRETRRSDYDHKEERDHRETRRSDYDRKDERGSKRYSRNEDEDYGLIRHRKDDEDSFRKNGRDNLEAEHGRSRRRGREEGEEHTNGRDEKNRHADSSKRVKYDDHRSEEMRKYDDDKRDNRDDVRARRRD